MKNKLNEDKGEFQTTVFLDKKEVEICCRIVPSSGKLYVWETFCADGKWHSPYVARFEGGDALNLNVFENFYDTEKGETRTVFLGPRPPFKPIARGLLTVRRKNNGF